MIDSSDDDDDDISIALSSLALTTASIVGPYAAPGTPAPDLPAPGTPAPGTPAAGTPAADLPAPSPPVPDLPAPGPSGLQASSVPSAPKRRGRPPGTGKNQLAAKKRTVGSLPDV